MHIRADAERMKVAKAVWDLAISVIAAYETAGALAELAASGRPPMPPLPALAATGGGTAAVAMSPAAYLELAEAIRKLIASGALDAGVVTALSMTLGSSPPSPPNAVHMAAGREPGAGGSKAPGTIKDTFPTSTVDEVVASSRRLSRGGQLPEGARAIAKKHGHAEAGGHASAFAGIEPTQANAEAVIRDVLQEPARTFYGDKVIDVYNAAGQGIRINRSTNAFIAFLEGGLATQ